MSRKPSKINVKKRARLWISEIAQWNGKPYRFSFEEEQQARVWAADAFGRMAQGLDPQEPTPKSGVVIHGRRGGKSIRELYDYVAGRDYSGGRSGDGRALIAMRKACEAVGWETRVAGLTYEHVEIALIAQGKERRNAIGTVNKRRNYLNIMFQHGFKLGWMPKPILLDLVKGRLNHRWFRITPALEEAMLKWALANRTAETGYDWYDFLVLSLYAGQRANVTLRIRLGRTTSHPTDGWADRDAIVLPRGDNDVKEMRLRGVPIREIVMEVVNRRRAALGADSTGRIFQRVQSDRMLRPGGLMSGHQWKRWTDSMWAQMKESLLDHPEVVRQRREGMPAGQDFCIHIMRSEFVSRLADQGFEPLEIMQYTGHKTLSVVEGYIVDQDAQAWRRAERRKGTIPDGLPAAPCPSFAPTPILRIVQKGGTSVGIRAAAASSSIGIVNGNARAAVAPATMVETIVLLVGMGRNESIQAVIGPDREAWVAAMIDGGRPDLVVHVVGASSY